MAKNPTFQKSKEKKASALAKNQLKAESGKQENHKNKKPNKSSSTKQPKKG